MCDILIWSSPRSGRGGWVGIFGPGQSGRASSSRRHTAHEGGGDAAAKGRGGGGAAGDGHGGALQEHGVVVGVSSGSIGWWFGEWLVVVGRWCLGQGECEWRSVVRFGLALALSATDGCSLLRVGSRNGLMRARPAAESWLPFTVRMHVTWHVVPGGALARGPDALCLQSDVTRFHREFKD